MCYCTLKFVVHVPGMRLFNCGTAHALYVVRYRSYGSCVHRLIEMSVKNQREQEEYVIDWLHIAFISAKFWKRLSIQKTSSWAVGSPVQDLGFPQRCWGRFKVPWDVTLCRWASSAGRSAFTFVVQQYRKKMKAVWSLETPTKRQIKGNFNFKLQSLNCWTDSPHVLDPKCFLPCK